jgi:CheY-like chemotaxis protein
MASRILLADDSITIQKVVNLTFADEGIEVVAVSSGDIAERRLPEVCPDLVLADIFMPGKNGYELCEAIKENSQFQHIPVVLLVGAFEPFDQAEANRVKADAHLTKPFESRTLVETVRRLISTSGEASASSGTGTPSVRDEGEEAIDALAPAETSTPHVAPVAKIDFSAMMPENNYDSTPPIRTTGELASPAAEISHSAFDMGAADTREASLISPNVNEPIEVFEFSGNGDFAVSDSRDSLSMDHQGMVEDFERNDVLEPIAETYDPLSFRGESNSLLDVDISGAGEGESWYIPSVLESTQADQQPVAAEWQSATDNSSVHSAADLSIYKEGTLEAVREPADTACATLLAVDEPLGDVFFEETATVHPVVLSQPPSGDALGFEFAESDVAGIAGSEATQFDLVETFEQPTQETSFDFVESPAAEIPVGVDETPLQEFAPEVHQSTGEGADVRETVVEAHETVAEMHETAAHTLEYAAQMPEPAAQMPEPPAQTPESVTRFADVAQASDVEVHMPEATAQMPEATAQMPEAVVEMKEHTAPETADAPHDAGAYQDWTTPQATIQSTADLDSIVMPAQADVPQGPAPFEPEPVMTESSDESGFTSAHMWTEEEARFTPIDIEAVALEDAPVDNSTQSEQQSETAFVVSSVLAEELPAKVETSIEDELEESKSAAVASDLSAAAIDQIVRRVLSQMSESVVREVAWEVVPDCVERVIEQLTRESLSKRV